MSKKPSVRMSAQAQKAEQLDKMQKEEIKASQKRMEAKELQKLMRVDSLNREVSLKDATTEKQRKVIDSLEKENKNLVSNLKVMQSGKRCVEEMKQSEAVANLFSQKDELDKEISQEKKFIEDLELQIRKETLLIELNKKKSKSDVNSEFYAADVKKRADRNMEAMKSRLNAEQVQLSTTKKENAALRERIETLQKSKVHFNELFEEFITKLNKGKKVMEDAVEQSKIQFKKREELVRKIQALKERDAADLKRRQNEMQDLHMKHVEDSSISRYKQRILLPRHRLDQTAKASKRANLQREMEEKRFEELTDMLEKIRVETGLDECSDICDLVVMMEADNFALFKYNNDVRHQVEALTEKTMELLTKVQDEQDEAYQWMDNHERANQEMTRKLHFLEEGASEVRDEFEANQRLFDRLLEKIMILFKMMKCDKTPLEQLLGENEEVTQFNFRLYLDLIESKLVTLLKQVPRKTDVVLRSPIKPGGQGGNASATNLNVLTDKVVITRLCWECEDQGK